MTGTGNAHTATEFLTMVASGSVREAYQRHVAHGFKHHNPYFPAGRQALLVAMQGNAAAEPHNSFTVKQVIGSGDRVAVLSRLQRGDAVQEYAVVHILRFEGAKIIEMWDVAQEIPPESPNEDGMF